eukprot:1552237-Pleurochrysis_carterae.AAC.2
MNGGCDCFVPFERLDCEGGTEAEPPPLSECIDVCARAGATRKPGTVHSALKAESMRLAQAHVAEVTRQEYVAAVGVDVACLPAGGTRSTLRSARQPSGRGTASSDGTEASEAPVPVSSPASDAPTTPAVVEGGSPACGYAAATKQDPHRPQLFWRQKAGRSTRG